MKKVLIILLCAVMVCSMAACGGAGMQTHSNYAEDYPFLEKVEDFSSIQGKAMDVGENLMGGYYVATEDAVYTDSFDGPEEVFKAKKKIKSIALTGLFSMILENQDGSHSVYVEGEDDIYFEAEGVDAEKAIAVSSNSFQRELFLIKESDAGYIVDYYTITDGKVKAEKLGIPLILSVESTGESFGLEDITEVSQIIQHGHGTAYLTSDGDMYYSAQGYVWDSIEEKISLRYPLLGGIEKVFANDTIEGHIVAKKGDKKNLYVYPYIYTEGDDVVTVSMPEDYTIADIKSVLVDDDLIVEFNDGSIYTAEEQNETMKLIKHEELSTLNGKGEILGMGKSTIRFLAVMADNSVYEF